MERFYSELADYYDYFLRGKDYKTECDFIISHIGKKNHCSILELGCGTGNHLQHFGNLGFHMTGIDKSVQMLEHARKKCLNATFIKADFTTNWIEKVNTTFDCIVCLGTTICYAHGYNTLLHIVQQVEMALRKEGIFVFDLWKYSPGDTGSIVDRIFVKTENIEFIRATEWFPESEYLISKDCFIVPCGEGYRAIFDIHKLYLYDINLIIEMFLNRDWNITIYSGFRNKDFQYSNDRAVFIAKRNNI